MLSAPAAHNNKSFSIKFTHWIRPIVCSMQLVLRLEKGKGEKKSLRVREHRSHWNNNDEQEETRTDSRPRQSLSIQEFRSVARTYQSSWSTQKIKFLDTSHNVTIPFVFRPEVIHTEHKSIALTFSLKVVAYLF